MDFPLKIKNHLQQIQAHMVVTWQFLLRELTVRTPKIFLKNGWLNQHLRWWFSNDKRTSCLNKKKKNVSRYCGWIYNLQEPRTSVSGLLADNHSFGVYPDTWRNLAIKQTTGPVRCRVFPCACAISSGQLSLPIIFSNLNQILRWNFKTDCIYMKVFVPCIFTCDIHISMLNIYIYIHTYTYIYIYIYISTYIYIYIHIYIDRYKWFWIYEIIWPSWCENAMGKVGKRKGMGRKDGGKE